MRKTLITAALLLAFSCPALAGEMGTPGSPTPPPPQPASAVQEPTDTDQASEMPNGVADSLTQTALDLLALLPSLL
jgi:hypothetical protein